MKKPDLLAGLFKKYLLMSICEHRIVLHDAVYAGTYLCNYSLVLRSVKNLLNELGNDYHHVLLGAACGDGGGTEAQT